MKGKFLYKSNRKLVIFYGFVLKTLVLKKNNCDIRNQRQNLHLGLYDLLKTIFHEM